ncbi:bifunctional diguanylate cyclase/phosphodiesterase [Halopseudomonas salegens]|uniref:cyclic-guanylate-specific phosphodiesterase n=1 Tax=Halopseudomonas salegens TaxID=1434072 RepID=A0A1H2E6W0_9GAMM|nr:EAL domain-containing protein [Halopseudomonas salegens]SDT90709.1 PAS domain S-box-containing protein/diguanylate cyclase (GGDEF) domain-containing protein [Halopseudomonas salegens]
MTHTPISRTLLTRVHISHRQTLLPLLLLLTGMLLVLLLFMLMPPPLWLQGQANYLPLHMLLETLAIVAAACIFAVSWATHKRLGTHNLLILACGFLVVALLDFSHMLSYQGMPDFVTPADPEKAIAFWLAARAVAALSLLWVAFASWQTLSQRHWRWTLLSLGLLLTMAVHGLILGLPQHLPALFIQGQGLTPLKVGMEYALIGIHILTAWRLWQLMRLAQKFNASALFAASLAMAMGGFCFTLYASVTDHFNLLGHVFKVIAYGLLFRGIFIEGVDKPFNELAQSRAKLQATFDAIPDMLFELDQQQRVVNFHPAADSRLQLSPESLLGKTPAALLPAQALHVSKLALEQASKAGFAQSPPFVWQGEKRRLWLQLSAAARMINGRTDGHVVLVRDVTELKAQEERIIQLAHFDSLTGLPNRTLFEERVNLSIHLAQRQNSSLAILFIDLDHFKHINDTLGHTAGDALLCAVAERLGNNLRDEDTLSRQGGDEFVLALPGADAAGAAHVAQRLLDSMAQPIQFADNTTTITASIGIAIYPMDGVALGNLMQHADAAMYQAKALGRNEMHFFTSNLQERMSRSLTLENALRGAIERNELSLHYQPQWLLPEQRLVGFEALLRWQHPELGTISPSEFIPIAESSGQIIQLGEWVIATGLQQLASWQQDGHSDLRLAINISAVQFRRMELVVRLAAALHAHQLQPGCLELELTEGVAMENPVHASQQLKVLHDLGVRLAIDDFGTGFSSLAQLRHFPVDTLKIDRSFIEYVDTDNSSLEMLRSIIQLAHNLSVDTLAEGVETPSQLKVLSELGCGQIQGFIWGKPQPADACTRYLQQMA